MNAMQKETTKTSPAPAKESLDQYSETVFVGIDNGVSGSIGIIKPRQAQMMFMPTRSELSYTKAKRNITRINWQAFRQIIIEWLPLGRTDGSMQSPVKVFLERPLVNPMRFMATCSAIRALEATLIVIEMFRLPLQYMDSKQWQKIMLPSGLKGTPELKKASMDVGCRLFPHLSDIIKKQGDADSLLMAEAARRGNW